MPAPKSEKTRDIIPEDLVTDIRKLFADVEKSKLTIYWEIGKKIVEHFSRTDESDELEITIHTYTEEDNEKLAELTGMSASTLRKCAQFARQYEKDQVDRLCKGKFTMSWRIVYHNLKKDPEQFVSAYEKAETRKEFLNEVMTSSSKSSKPDQKPKNTPTPELETKGSQSEATSEPENQEAKQIAKLLVDTINLTDKKISLIGNYLNIVKEMLLEKESYDEILKILEEVILYTEKRMPDNSEPLPNSEPLQDNVFPRQLDVIPLLPGEHPEYYPELHEPYHPEAIIKPFARESNIKLYNDDCLKVLKSFPSNSVNHIVTDPPYGIGYAPWDQLPDPAVWEELFRVSSSDAILIAFGAPKTFSKLVEDVKKGGWLEVSSFFWLKPGMRPKNVYIPSHEPAIIAAKQPLKLQNIRLVNDRIHPKEKGAIARSVYLDTQYLLLTEFLQFL